MNCRLDYSVTFSKERSQGLPALEVNFIEELIISMSFPIDGKQQWRRTTNMACAHNYLN